MRARLAILIVFGLLGGLFAGLVGSGPQVTTETAKEGFPFPKDRGGKLLADLLPPSEQLPSLPSDHPSGPRRFAPPPTLERTELPLPPSQAVLPRPRGGMTLHSSRPPALREELPLADYRGEPLPPQRPQLAAGPRFREWSPDLSQPLPLPVLGRKQLELAPVDDLTAEVSLAAALTTLALQRGKPAPFLRLTLPDPFEHRHAVGFRKELTEQPTPVTASPRLPGR